MLRANELLCVAIGCMATGPMVFGDRPNHLVHAVDEFFNIGPGYAGNGQAINPNMDRLAVMEVHFSRRIAKLPLWAARSRGKRYGAGMYFSELKHS